MVDICWIDFTEPLSNFIGRVTFRHISGFTERERESTLLISTSSYVNSKRFYGT